MAHLYQLLHDRRIDCCAQSRGNDGYIRRTPRSDWIVAGRDEDRAAAQRGVRNRVIEVVLAVEILNVRRPQSSVGGDPTRQLLEDVVDIAPVDEILRAGDWHEVHRQAIVKDLIGAVHVPVRVAGILAMNDRRIRAAFHRGAVRQRDLQRICVALRV